MASPKNVDNSKRGAAREKVRAMQEAQRRKDRRRRSLIITSAVVVAAILIGVVVFAISSAQASKTDVAKVVKPSGVTSTAGITKKGPAGGASAPVKIVEYLDYQCPACKQFDTQVGPYLAQEVAAGTVEVEYHPLNFLKERGSSTDYSLRSANAAYCLADDAEGDIAAFSDILYAEQLPERGVGLPDAELVSAAKKAGASGAVEKCITSGKHSGYVNQQTKAANIQSTPTVMIDGKQVQDTSLAGIKEAISAAQK